MSRRRSRIGFGVALVTTVTMIGAAWFALVEGFGWVDALYQSVITVSTVGFAEVEPLDTSGRLFTIGLIVIGVASIGFALAAFVELLVESALEQLTSRRREKTLDRLTGHTLVCGFGRTGRAVLDLLPPGHLVGIIEIDADRCLAADQAGFVALEADCTLDETLETAGVRRADGLIVCLANDSDAISTVLSARAVNSSLRIVARASSAHSAQKMRLAGADQVVSPVEMAARRLVADSVQPELASFLDAALHDRAMDLSIRALHIGPTSAAAAMPVDELEALTGVRVIGSQTPDGQLVDAATPVDGLSRILFAVGGSVELDAAQALGKPT